MPIISYAQNFEDVLLNRIFGGKQNGFYIDVGAAHPIIFSVTKWFYDNGWNGINIEPIPDFYEQLKRDRPRDINLNIALGNKDELRTFYKSEFNEASSFFYEYAKNAESKIGIDHKNESVKFDVQVKTLKDICIENKLTNIDFLKIDVEGFEKEVLEGADFELFRPIVVVIEATEPNSGINPFTINDNLETTKWENILIENKYKRIYFDGLNCFYLREEDYHLHKGFSVPVHVYEFVFPECIIDNLIDYQRIIPKVQYNSYLSSCLMRKKEIEIQKLNLILNKKEEEITSLNEDINQYRQKLIDSHLTIYKLKERIFKLSNSFIKRFLFWRCKLP